MSKHFTFIEMPTKEEKKLDLLRKKTDNYFKKIADIVNKSLNLLIEKLIDDLLL